MLNLDHKSASVSPAAASVAADPEGRPRQACESSPCCDSEEITGKPIDYTYRPGRAGPGWPTGLSDPLFGRRRAAVGRDPQDRNTMHFPNGSNDPNGNDPNGNDPNGNDPNGNDPNDPNDPNAS